MTDRDTTETRHTTEPRHRTVVIGVGNPLMGDDGVGLASLELLREWNFEPYVQCVDGGTWGMNLLPFVEQAERLIILDAIEAGLEPGAPVSLESDEIPRFFSTKLSPHQIELREVLALAELRDALPAEIVALGLQPGCIEMSEELSPEVEAGIEGLTDCCVERLRSWGHRASRRPAMPSPSATRSSRAAPGG